MTKLAGLTDAENDLLQLVFAIKPWGRDRVAKAVGRFLDGDEHALDKAPALKARFENAIAAAKQDEPTGG